jgi:methionyl-tRNA formyltransferase
MDGRTETGITTMFMAEGLDTGDILEMLTTPIGENDNFEDIHDRLAEMGAELLPHTVKGLEDGTVTPTPQDERGSCYAEKINKEDCVIDFSKSARVIHNQIRGISPIPLAFTTLNGKMLKVVASRVVKDEGKGEAGRVIDLSDGGIHVQCGEGVIALTSVRPEGKGTMPAADFIRGRKVALGDLLGK